MLRLLRRRLPVSDRLHGQRFLVRDGGHLLAGAAARLRSLRAGLAVILAAVAVTLLLADVWEFPSWSAPAFISAVLAVVVAVTIRDNRRAGRIAGRAGDQAPQPRREVAGLGSATRRRGGRRPG